MQQALIKPARNGLAVTWTHWRGPGRITFTPQSGPAKDGTPVTTQELREDDGIHFTMAGSEYFADQVYPPILSVLGLEP